MITSIRTLDFGDLAVVDRSVITKFDNLVGYIDMAYSERGYDVYCLANGVCVAVLEA